MPSVSKQEADQDSRVIIHHLSDIHFHDVAENDGRVALYQYIDYLQKLERNLLPHLIVITGDLITRDLTVDEGAKDLSILAAALRGLPTAQPHRPAQSTKSDATTPQICVVPGPHDITRDNGRKLSYHTFYAAFSDFIIPAEHYGTPPHLLASQTPQNPSLCVAYPLNTCFTPDTLPPKAKHEYHEYGNRYETFRQKHKGDTSKPFWPWAARSRKQNNAGGKADDLRKAFLQLIEENWLAILDAGVIEEKDLKSFQNWTKSQLPPAQPAASPPAQPASAPKPKALKILITHHPLLDQPDRDQNAANQNTAPNKNEPPNQNTASNQDEPPNKEARKLQERMHDLLQSAKEAGFQLALHGHLHKPHVLSDLSILDGLDLGQTLRQVGAGSLAGSKTFNEITASYRPDGDMWNLEIRTVNVSSDEKSATLMLLNPVEDLAERVKQLEKKLEHLRQFQLGISEIMRQFSESLRQNSARRSQRDRDIPLPQSAMISVNDLVRDTIFDNTYDVRVSLTLKTFDKALDIWVLENAYLNPPLQDPRRLYYPASVAAWAMIFGKIFVYPDPESDELEDNDYLWLRESGKIDHLLDAAEKLKAYLFKTSLVGTGEPKRVEDIQEALSKLRGSPRERLLKRKDFYQGLAEQGDFRVFISVPIPSRADRVPPIVPEIGTLNVNVRERLRDPGSKKDPLSPEELVKEAFTDERRAMLSTLSSIIGTILCSSSALGNPHGSWDDREDAFKNN